MQDVRARSIAVVLAAGLVLTPGCGSDSIDACNIVTRQDASMLFGHEAENRTDEASHEGTHVWILPISACVWRYEAEDDVGSVSSQSLGFHVFQPTDDQRIAPANSEAFPVGDDGYIFWSESLGVNINWIQDGFTISLSYFSVGDDMPTHASRVEPMKELARVVSDRW